LLKADISALSAAILPYLRMGCNTRKFVEVHSLDREGYGCALQR